jgi:Cytosol aminopeptidase family, catalytic domain
MLIEVTEVGPDAVGADLIAVATGARASDLGVPERAAADADPVALVYREHDSPLAVVALEPSVEGLWTAAARAVCACQGGGTVAWGLDPALDLAAPANVMSPTDLSERVVKFAHLDSDIVDPARAVLGALAGVGGSSPIPPCLFVLRHAPPGAPETPQLALVGKAVTFDTGWLLPEAAARHRPSEG